MISSFALLRLRKINLLGVATALLFVVLWEGFARTNTFNLRYLPAPSAIAGHLGDLFGSSLFYRNVLHTLEVTLAGWAIASAVGVAVGLSLGLSSILWRWSMATVELLRALPGIAFLPVAVLIFGFSTKMELWLVIYVSLWPVVISSVDGVRGVSPLVRDVGKTLRLTHGQAIRKIVLPSSVGPIIVGLRLALTASLVVAVIAEMVGNPHGLGFQLIYEQQSLRPELMYGVVGVIGLLGVLLNVAFVGLIRTLAPGVAHVSGVGKA